MLERELYASPYVGDVPPVLVTLPESAREVECVLWALRPQADGSMKLEVIDRGVVKLPAEVYVR